MPFGSLELLITFIPKKSLPVQLDAQKRPRHTVIEIGYRVAGVVEEKRVKPKTKQ